MKTAVNEMLLDDMGGLEQRLKSDEPRCTRKPEAAITDAERDEDE